MLRVWAVTTAKGRVDLMKRLVIAGSRDDVTYQQVEDAIDMWVEVNGVPDLVIVGGARGVDTYAQTEAEIRDWKVLVLRADWALHGKRAGYLRNKEMAMAGTHLLALRANRSRGTGMMIDLANDFDLEVTVIGVT